MLVRQLSSNTLMRNWVSMKEDVLATISANRCARSNHVLQLDAHSLYNCRICLLTNFWWSFRYFWTEKIRNVRVRHIAHWHCHCHWSPKHTDDDSSYDFEGYWKRESTTGVSLTPTPSNENMFLTAFSLAAVAEIVPNKHRGNAQAALDIVTLPWAVFGSLTGNAMVKFYKLSFRINFIIGAILNVLSITTIWMWYHPVGSFPFS
jgi:hypothetical protein